MSRSASDRPRAISVDIDDGALVVRLEDGRALLVPLEWFPRLRDATPAQLARYQLVGQGVGIHWPELDEDISVRALLVPETRGAPLRHGP